MRICFVDIPYLNAFRAVRITGLVWCVAVRTAYGRMGACGTLFANWESAGVLFRLMGLCTDRAAGVIPAQGSRMSVALALAALGASSVRNVIIQFALAVADDEVLAANIGFRDVACQCHNNCGVCLLLSSVSRGEPPRGLPLDELGVIGGKTL